MHTLKSGLEVRDCARTDETSLDLTHLVPEALSRLNEDNRAETSYGMYMKSKNTKMHTLAGVNSIDDANISPRRVMRGVVLFRGYKKMNIFMCNSYIPAC